VGGAIPVPDAARKVTSVARGGQVNPRTSIQYNKKAGTLIRLLRHTITRTNRFDAKNMPDARSPACHQLWGQVKTWAAVGGTRRRAEGFLANSRMRCWPRGTAPPGAPCL